MTVVCEPVMWLSVHPTLPAPVSSQPLALLPSSIPYQLCDCLLSPAFFSEQSVTHAVVESMILARMLAPHVDAVYFFAPLSNIANGTCRAVMSR